jgi:hypothetical protein
LGVVRKHKEAVGIGGIASEVNTSGDSSWNSDEGISTTVTVIHSRVVVRNREYVGRISRSQEVNIVVGNWVAAIRDIKIIVSVRAIKVSVSSKVGSTGRPIESNVVFNRGRIV